MRILLKYYFRSPALLFCILLFSTIHAQNKTPTHQTNGEFIKEWLVLGPIFSADFAKDFLLEQGGESNINPKEGDSFVTSKKDTIRWKYYKSKSNVIDLLNAIGNYNNAIAYTFCKLTSKTKGEHSILLGSDDGAAVWINGKLIYDKDVERLLFIDSDIIETELGAGDNSCLVKISQRNTNWAFAMRALPGNRMVKTEPKFYLPQNNLEEGILLTSTPWKYSPEDNEAWAKPNIDDSDWGQASPALIEGEISEVNWRGVGWFRLRVAVDPSLYNKSLGLAIWQAGETQIYVDGKLTHSYAQNSEEWRGMHKVISFDEQESHVIAVRYSNTSLNYFHNADFSAGFFLWLVDVDRMSEYSITRERRLIGYQMFFASLMIAVGLLHLILFLFFPRLKQNLYFALFLFFYAATIYFDYESSLSVNIGEQLTNLRCHRSLYVLFVLLQLRFLYSLFYDNLPKQFWLILAISLITGVFITYKPTVYFEFMKYIDIIIIVEIFRVIITELIKKWEGTWIIALAFLTYYFFGIFDTLMDSGIIVPFMEMENPYAFGSVGFFIAMSVYLSRDFARNNKKIVEQEIEQKLLEAENKRQSKELEDARKLQISMLPKDLPQLPHLEIGVYMKTATEVGGDYYDFKLQDDGTLTAVIGDATGHGMQAGTMVSAAKSLFNALALQEQPINFLKKASKAIKEMGLKKMFMALTIAKFSGKEMWIAAAGMPFPLIYRTASGSVEEIILKGMPLGGFADFPYGDKKVMLEKGDTVILMSDGFEETFNKKRELLGTANVKKLFNEVASKSPQQIFDYLNKAGLEWADGHEQEDDVTFVVIKVK